MSTSTSLKFSLELAAIQEELATLAGEVSQMSDYAYRLIGAASGLMQ